MAHTTVKISQLPSASHSDITSATAVLPIIDGSTTKQITVDNLFGAATNITASGNISASGTIFADRFQSATGGAAVEFNDDLTVSGILSSSLVSSNFSVFAHSASFSYVSASKVEVGPNTLVIGGTPFSKTNLDDLKAGKSLNSTQLEIGGVTFTKTELENLKGGKSISTDTTKQVVHGGDPNTFIQMKTNAPGRVIHKVSGVPLFDMTTSSLKIGDPVDAFGDGVPLVLQGSAITVDGPTIMSGSMLVSGSATVSGSFTVLDLINVLGNYGQTGSFSVSGSTTLAGDVNADGAVTVTDLLTVLGGFGASGSCEVSGGLEISGSGLVIDGGSKALIVTGSTEMSGSVTVSGSFTVTDLLTVLADYGQTGSFSVSGSSTLDGDVNLDGAVTVTDLLTVLSGFGASGSCAVSGSLEISGSIVAGSPPALVITGSTEITGSTTVDGPFAINNLLDLLANYGAAGIPTGSGEGGVSVGDINLDGQVNVNDMLLLLAGMGNPNTLVTNLTIPQNTNYQLIGPEITVSQSIVVTVGTNSFFSIT